MILSYAMAQLQQKSMLELLSLWLEGIKNSLMLLLAVQFSSQWDILYKKCI